jgi:hypothetical protein
MLNNFVQSVRLKNKRTDILQHSKQQWRMRDFRTIGISKDTVAAALMRIEDEIWFVNFEYENHKNNNFNVEILQVEKKRKWMKHSLFITINHIKIGFGGL